MPAARALIVVRLSKLTDVSTSPARQEQVCRSFCAQRGWSVVDVARDLNVSAGLTSPFDRPELRPWLDDRTDEYDVIVFYRTDRLVRRITHMSRMIEWTEKTGKNLASATEPFDLSTGMGQAMATMIAIFGQMELDAISERNTGAAQHNIRAGKYRGGTTPAGYRSEKDDAGDWRLAPDEDGMAPVVREIASRIIAGERLARIVLDLNSREVQTAKDRQAELNGREVKGHRWTISNVRRMVLSPTVIGQVVHRELESDGDGKPVRKNGAKVYGSEQVLFRDGEPLVRAEPLIDPADYYRVKAILAERSEANPKGKRGAEPSLLTQVLFCGRCGEPMYRLKGGPGRQPRYRCGSTAKGGACGNGSVIVKVADEEITRRVLATVGEIDRTRPEYRPGTRHGETLAEIDGQLATLAESVTRFPAGSPALTGLLSRVDALSAKRADLVAQPETESGWTNVPTGETYGQYWARASAEERNDFLRTHVRAEITQSDSGDKIWSVEFRDVLGMIDAVSPGRVDRQREWMTEREIPQTTETVVGGIERNPNLR